MNIKHLSILLALGTTLYSTNRVTAQELNVVTTLPSLASITEQIGGDNIRVSSITRGVQDAHYVEAKPSYMVRLNKADLLVYSGLELEIGWLPLLIRGARNGKITVGANGNLNASLALSDDQVLERPRGEVDRSMGDVHPSGNPHYLLNPNNCIRVAELIADKLIELDPSNRTYYEQNLDGFTSRLQEKIEEFERLAAHLEGVEVVCYHVHWSYLLEWLGIRTIGFIELRPGIPPTPRHKRAIIQLMQDKGIEVVVISSWKEPTRAQEVANAADATLVVLPGEVGAMRGTDDYITWIEYMITHLVEAFPAQSR